jgi:hypothetical protein
LQLGGDLQQRAKTIAHEIGHLVDMVGNKGIAADDLQSMEQNILGRIAWIAGYKEKFLAGWRGGPAPLSSSDRARLRAEAERLASSTAEIEIDEEIVETTPLTPQDIKSIWNSVTPNLPKELINYVKGLSDAAKRSIVMSAMKGIVPEELKRFQTTKVVGTRKVKKTVQSGGSDTEIEATLAEMIEEEIKKRQLLELDTVRKEAEGLSEWWRPYDKENASRQFADYRQSGPEIFADAISVFFNAPGEMQQRAPNLFRGIVGHMAGNPKFAKAYLELQGILQGDPADYMQRRLDAMEKSYVQGDQIIVADMNMRRRAQASLAEVLYQEGIGAALREFTDKVGPAMMAAFINRGAEVLHAQDKGKAINSQLDKILTEENNVYHSIERLMRIDSPTQAYLTELQDKVYGRLKEAGLTEDHLGQLLELRRTLVGRDNKINPRGMNYDIADKQVEHMINMLGEEKFNELHLIARDFYDLNFGIMERALESGLISKAMFEKTVVPNRYSYATYSVLQYLKSTADWSIYQVKGTFDDIGNPYRTTAEKMVSIQRAANLNAVKREVIGHLRRDLPSEVRLMTGTNLSLRPGESRLRVLVDGKQLTYAVPQQYTQLFESATNPALSTVYKNLNSLTYGIFYKLYISYNPAFALRNVGRDAFGTWHRLGAVIDGVRKQRIEESIAGGKSRAEAMKEASEPLRMRELIGLMLKPENITAARRRALGVSDPKVLELLRMSALDAGYSQTSRHAAVAMFDDEKTRDLMERAGVMPRSEAAKWQASAYEFLRKSMGQQLLDKTQHWMSILSVPKLIDTTEALMKIAGYDALKNRGFTDSQMMYMLHNVVGTQNTRYKGILHPELNGAFMFFSARIAGLRGHVIAAQASPQEYAKRSAITAGGSMLVGKLARMGAFGTFIAMMYSYIPEEEEERSFVLPLYLLQDPGDGLYKTVYLAIPRDFSDSFAATMFNVTWDAIGKQELDTGKAIAELKNATIGTLAPPWDITRVWYEYATMGDRGPIPIDSFYNRPIMSRADQMDPDHWHARRKLLAWTLRKFGAVGEWMKPVTAGLLGEDMTSGKLTPIEKMFRVPGVGALLRVSNRGMTAKMYSDAENSEGQSAQVTNMLGSQTNALRRRINTLQDVPPEKLPKEQQTLLGQALFWDKELYRPARASMLEAVKLGRDGEARQISRQLEEATRLYEEMAIAERTGDEKRALEAQRKLESFLAAP